MVEGEVVGTWRVRWWDSGRKVEGEVVGEVEGEVVGR